MAILTDSETRPSDMIDLASSDAGGRVLWCSDEFFAAGQNLLNPDPAIFDSEKYTDRGKWMDGWESRRRRTPGHDTAIIALGITGTVRLININTAHFTGNYPAFAKVWGCNQKDASLEELRGSVEWRELTRAAALKGGSTNLVIVREPQEITHLKFEIFPAGGVARLRVYGDAALSKDANVVNLVGQEYGGQAIACSDMYFSEMHNLLKATPAANMGDGWETKRSRPPGDDWVILKLGHTGVPETLEIDTAFFKGNFPQSFALDALLYPNADPWQLLTSPLWTEVISNTELGPDRVHQIDWPQRQPISHIRIRIYPDGGISRVRLKGKWHFDKAALSPEVTAFNDLNESAKISLLTACCGSKRWVEQMISHGPFVSLAELRGTSASIWWTLDENDWLEAFSHHPKIGASKAALQRKFAATAELSANEQKGVEQASEELLEDLASRNREYESKFGFIFIVCAQGKSAEEMYTLLQARMPHSRDNEVRIAAGEQSKITWLRLEKHLKEIG